jgi:hypothetical protein
MTQNDSNSTPARDDDAVGKPGQPHDQPKPQGGPSGSGGAPSWPFSVTVTVKVESPAPAKPC